MKIILYLLLYLISLPIFAEATDPYYCLPMWNGTESCVGAKGPEQCFASAEEAMAAWRPGSIAAAKRCSIPSCANPQYVCSDGLYFFMDWGWVSNGCTGPTTDGCSNVGGNFKCPTGIYNMVTKKCDGGVSQQCNPTYPHPCSIHKSITYELACQADLIWDYDSCQYVHGGGNCTYTESDGPLGGVFDNPSGTLGTSACFFGCEYRVNGKSGNEILVQTTGQSCSPPAATPTDPIDDTFQANDVEAKPDPGTSTNCYDINGEEVCTEIIPNNTCVTTQGGNYVCVGTTQPYPTPDDPNTPQDIDIQIEQNDGRTIIVYSDGKTQNTQPINVNLEFPPGDIEIQTEFPNNPSSEQLETVDQEISTSSVMTDSGSCPSPIQLNYLGNTYSFSWDLVCRLATGVRPYVLILASLGSVLFIFSVARNKL